MIDKKCPRLELEEGVMEANKIAGFRLPSNVVLLEVSKMDLELHVPDKLHIGTAKAEY